MNARTVAAVTGIPFIENARHNRFVIQSMAVLIDCYNLLHATMPPSLAGLDEAGLMRLLARGRFADQPITIVCDGKPKPHAPPATVGSIQLIYSGPHRSADDVIMDLIDQNHAPRQLLVVSSDRAIQQAARRRRAIAISADAFIPMLSPQAAPHESPRPTEPLSEEQVDHWLREFGLDEDHQK